MKFILSAVSLSLIASGSAWAATAPGSFDVNTNVQGTCVLVSASNINFGEYDPAAADLMSRVSRGSIAVRCTAGTTNVKIALDQGANPGEGSTCSLPARRLKSTSGEYLRYFIGVSDYAAGSDGMHSMVSQNWGCFDSGTPSTTSVQTIKSFTSSLQPVVLNPSAKIYARQDVSIGTYSDTVGVTVTF